MQQVTGNYPPKVSSQPLSKHTLPPKRCSFTLPLDSTIYPPVPPRRPKNDFCSLTQSPLLCKAKSTMQQKPPDVYSNPPPKFYPKTVLFESCCEWRCVLVGREDWNLSCDNGRIDVGGRGGGLE